MKAFSVERDCIDLPRGAWSKSHRLRIRWRGREIAALSQGQFRAYLFPVYTPAGVAVTAESPVDHPHHRSIWVGADQVICHLPYSTDRFESATYNLYVDEVFQGRAPGRILAVDADCAEMDDDRLRITQTLHWQGPEEWGAPERRTLALETRTIDVRPGTVANLIDLRSQLRPTEWDLTLGPTRHAYFGVRLADGLRPVDGATMIDSSGRLGAEAVSGRCGGWVDCSGLTPGQGRAGLALFPHDSSPALGWSAADWGLLGLNPFARAARPLARGEVLDLAVRIVVHDGDAVSAGVAGLFRSFRAAVEEEA